MAASPLNCVILGATGRVAGLLRAAWQATPPENMRFYFAPRQVEPADLQRFARQGVPGSGPGSGRVDVMLCLRGVIPGNTRNRVRHMSDNTRLALETCQLAETCKAGHVFLASSMAVYGAPVRAKPFGENDTPAPVSDYGRAKLAMEQAVLTIRNMSGRLTCLRIGNVAGADQLLLNALNGAQPLFLDRFANGASPRRAYIGPESLARVLTTLFRCAEISPATLPDILNVAAPAPVAMADLLSALHAHRPGLDWQDRPAPAAALAFAGLDVTRLAAFVAFRASDSAPEEIIRQVLTCQSRR